MSDRPDLTASRGRGPRPAPQQDRDPVDPAPRGRAREHRPEPRVMRQFRLSYAEDDMLVALQERRGDRNLVDTQRWLLSVVVPALLDGTAGIELTDTGS